MNTLPKTVRAIVWGYTPPKDLLRHPTKDIDQGLNLVISEYNDIVMSKFMMEIDLRVEDLLEDLDTQAQK